MIILAYNRSNEENHKNLSEDRQSTPAGKVNLYGTLYRYW